MKTLKYLSLILAILSFAACNSGGTETTTSSTVTQAKEGKGGRYYGGIFKMNETEFFRSIYPLNVTETSGNRITNQVYEGLVQFSQEDLTIQPSLATHWDIDDSK